MKTLVSSIVLIVSAGLPCLAALGDTVASVEADQQKFQAHRKISQAQNYAVHEMTRDDGMVITEYVSTAGKVFGVSWKGPVIPDLSQLLGAHFAAFKSEVQGESRIKARRRGAAVRQGALVVESSGHPRDYFGRAYLSDQLPGGVTETVIQ